MEPISLQKLKQLLNEQYSSIFIIDVRSPEEFFDKRLKNTHNIPLETLPNKLQKIPGEKQIIVHCAHGFRAKRAAQFLEQEGYRPIFYVKGDIELWEDAGLDVLFENDQ
jgi:rhodanese-related sulfurtransferase